MGFVQQGSAGEYESEGYSAYAYEYGRGRRTGSGSVSGSTDGGSVDADGSGGESSGGEDDDGMDVGTAAGRGEGGLAGAVGQLSLNEDKQVRYHGKASGLHLLARQAGARGRRGRRGRSEDAGVAEEDGAAEEERGEGRNVGGIWLVFLAVWGARFFDGGFFFRSKALP